jgi:hypothetical protein
MNKGPMCNFWKIFKGLAVNLVLGFSCNFENSLKIIEKSEKCKSYFFGFMVKNSTFSRKDV